MGVRISDRTGAIMFWYAFESKYSPVSTCDEISARTLQIAIKRVANRPETSIKRMPRGISRKR